MAARAPALAKLTRPKHHDALPRPRLYARLDEARARPVIWVCAPPGAGKSTLVATWIEARKLPHLWYQVDVADSDPATFMHYLRRAADALVGRRAHLPPFASEPQQDLARFARSFCRELYAALPRGTVIVLDNFHEARAPAGQRSALAQGLEELPEGINVVVLSRADPPPEFARLVAGRRIARLDAAELRCTDDEAEALLGPVPVGAEAVRSLQRQSDGWAAALVLLREHLSRPNATLEDSVGEGREAIFRYFAGEILGRARPENRRAMMVAALLPSITGEEARALSGSEDAGRMLDYLYRRRLFVDRRRGAAVTYHFHALFRAFLRDEGARRLPAGERRALAARAAALVEARGEADAALALYREAADWEAMRRLVHVHALDWARHGRAQALSDAIDALPVAMREADPWLVYWAGRAWVFVEPARGQASLERAHAAFRDAGDLRGQALALNTIVTGHYYAWANFAPLDRWIPEFRRLLRGDAGALDRDSELRACAAFVVALLFRAPDDPDLPRCAQRLDALIDDEPDVNARMMAASTLFNYLNWHAKADAADALVARVTPLLARPEVTPLMQLWWRTHLAFWHFVNGRYDRAAAVSAEARAIAERYGLAAYLFEIDHGEASALVSKGALSEAKTLLDAMEPRLSPSRRMDWAYYHHLRATYEQRAGLAAAAVRSAGRAVALARETGLPAVQLPHFVARLGHALAGAGDRTGGLARLREAEALATAADRWAFGQAIVAVEAGFALDDGARDTARAKVEALVGAYKARGHSVFLRNRPDLAARLADFALREGLEVDFVRLLIARNHLVAPAGASSAWPFRLRVQVLGGFALVRDGVPVRFAGKAQQRPLDLLKLVVALGGRDVEAAAVTAALWPEADGAAAKASFDAALFRLRKLLDVDGAVRLAGGRLTLAPDLVWTDVGAVHAALDAAQAAVDTHADSAALAAAARALLATYAGPLAAGDGAAPWSAKPRDALRARVLRILLAVGATLEAAQDWATAVDVYRRGLEADNLAEPFYRGLMRALAQRGERAEALVAFRRCRELLSVVLGLPPSAETERLHRAIASGTLSAGAAGPAR